MNIIFLRPLSLNPPRQKFLFSFPTKWKQFFGLLVLVTSEVTDVTPRLFFYLFIYEHIKQFTAKR